MEMETTDTETTATESADETTQGANETAETPSEWIEDLASTAIDVGAEWGLSVVGGIIILIVGWIVAGWVGRTVRRSAAKSERFDQTLVPLLEKIVRLLILAFVIIAVLNNFGVQTASIIAVMGAAGLAVGLALQGALGNVASGVLLLTLRPFEVGDLVEAGGHLAVVEEIGLLATQLKGVDGVFLMMGNTKIWSSDIKNFGRNPIRRFDVAIGISYSDDIDRAIELCKDVLQQDDRVLKEPDTLVAVSDLGDSSVDLLVRGWTATPDWWPTQLAVRKMLKQRFDAEGVSIPFPQRDVHLIKDNAA